MEYNININGNKDPEIFGVVELPSDLVRELNRRIESHNGAVPYTPKRTEWQNLQDYDTKVIPCEQLSDEEAAIFDRTDEILGLIGGKPECVKSISIIETPHSDAEEFDTDPFGVIDIESEQVFIYRDRLKNLHTFAGALIFECSTAKINKLSATAIRSDLLFAQIAGVMASNVLNRSPKKTQNESDKFQDNDIITAALEDCEPLVGLDGDTYIYVKDNFIFMKVLIKLPDGEEVKVTPQFEPSDIAKVFLFRGDDHGYIGLLVRNKEKDLPKLRMSGEYNPDTLEKEYRVYFRTEDQMLFMAFAHQLVDFLKQELIYVEYDL